MIRLFGIAGLALSLGCSPGGGGGGDGTEDSTGGDSGGSSDTGADESTGTPPLACESSVGVTPLQRLTPAQYANVVRDIFGYAVDVSALDLPEKAGPFDANFSAPVSSVLVEQYRNLAEDVAADIDIAAALACGGQDEDGHARAHARRKSAGGRGGDAPVALLSLSARARPAR